MIIIRVRKVSLEISEPQDLRVRLVVTGYPVNQDHREPMDAM